MVFKKENKIHHECPYLGSVCSWKLEESKVYIYIGFQKKEEEHSAVYVSSEHTDMSKPEIASLNGEVPNIN